MVFDVTIDFWIWVALPLPVVIAAVISFYSAWGNGANDVANAMGTSVGSGALTLTGAIIIAAIFEFSGAVLVGAHVTDTVKGGIVTTAVFEGDLRLFVLAMIAADLSAAIWLTLSTFFSLPVSTTHSIIGAILGSGIVAGGLMAVDWAVVGIVTASWIISPLLGATMAYLGFKLLERAILERDQPVRATRRLAPLLVFLVALVLGMSIFFKGLSNLNLDFSLGQALVITSLIGLDLAVFVWWWNSRKPQLPPASDREAYREVERLFIVLQVATAASVAFAHGANDVANAIGPLAAVAGVMETGAIGAKAPVPFWVLVLGGTGIVFGLATYGYKVMKTVGERITELTPSRGFTAELSAAATILTFSRLGIPVSTTHTLVGAVLGVGLARGLPAVDLKVLGKIFSSWALTLPVAAVTSAGIYLALVFFLI